MRTFIWLLPISLCALCSHAQDTHDEDIDVQRITDEYLPVPDDDQDYEDLYENLVQRMSSQLDLNTVTPQELRSLHILNDAQIDRFMEYRNDAGTLLDIYELQIIPGFDEDVLKRLRPFVCVIDPSEKIDRKLFARILSPGHSYFVSRYERTLETKKGFRRSADSTSVYRGSPDKIYFRFRSSLPGDFSFGMTGEKDAGERIVLDPRRRQWGFDFTSWHCQVRNKGKIRNLIAGDFQGQFGQGLVVGGAFGLSKGGETVATLQKANVGFQPYTSVNENAYQRGLAITLEAFRGFEISMSYSYRFRDASQSGTYETPGVTSFQTSGYHRTSTEISHRKNIAEQNTTVVLNLNRKKVESGVVINYVHFDTEMRRRPALYNQHAFSGDRNLNTSCYINYRIANVSLFSEIARSMPGGWAMVIGSLVSAHPDLELAILYRNYQRDYHTFSSSAFSENTQPVNERGVYWGWKYTWSRTYSFNGYVDLFEFPWLGFRRYKPAHGYEWLLRGSYKPSKKVTVTLQYREEVKARNSAEASNRYTVEDGTRQDVSFQCDYGAGDLIRFKSRVQYNAYNIDNTTTEGWALVQDIGISKGPFQLSARHALFDTDHYDNRHYVYENDAWLSYSFPAYSGVGVRNYVLFEYKINKTLSIWLRYARTRMLHDTEIGTGHDVIEGNTKNDVKFQARIKF